MNFGYFDDTNKEYVITTPQTPLPWINYLLRNIFRPRSAIRAAAMLFIKMPTDASYPIPL